MNSTDNENSKPKHGGGPKTPEGKARSAKNALRHGLTGATVVLAGEDPNQFQELLANYIADYQPATTVQLDLVHELAVCRWRIQRCWTMESNLFDIAVGRNKPALAAEFKQCSRDFEFTLAFAKLAEEGRSLSLLNRYETRLTRRYNQVMKDLDRLQSKPPRDDDDPVPDTHLTPRPTPSGANCETNPNTSAAPVETRNPEAPQPSADPVAGVEDRNCETNSTGPATECDENCQTNSDGPCASADEDDETDPISPNPRRFMCIDRATGKPFEVSEAVWRRSVEAWRAYRERRM
jgi:hypothetical protein